MRLIGILSLVATVVAGAAKAEAPPVLGMQLGKPLALPQCEHDVIVAAVCQRTDLPGPDAGVWWIRVPIGGTTPGFIQAPDAGCVGVKDGVVNEIVLWTSGVDGQDQALELLSEKFGKPTSLTRRSVQNRMGAKFEAIAAFWARPGYEITLDGVGHDLDGGTVTIETDDHFKQRMASLPKPSL